MNRRASVACCCVAAIAAGCVSLFESVPSDRNTVVLNLSAKDGFRGAKLRFNGPTNQLPKQHQTTHVAQSFSVSCPGPRPVTGFVVYPKDAKAKSLPVRITFDGYGEGGAGQSAAGLDVLQLAVSADQDVRERARLRTPAG